MSIKAMMDNKLDKWIARYRAWNFHGDASRNATWAEVQLATISGTKEGERAGALHIIDEARRFVALAPGMRAADLLRHLEAYCGKGAECSTKI